MSQRPTSGTYWLRQTELQRAGQGGLGILMGLSYFNRHELTVPPAGGGLTILSATVDVFLGELPSSDLAIAAVAINGVPVVNPPPIGGMSPIGTVVQFRVSDVSSVVGNEYRIAVQATLSDGTVLDPESISINVVSAT